ncbi:ABC transporter substrate-binding protein [Natrononativus amylolyticus]|uniref:ABC transporter substrate-binding protein n=1 Tax=Natrononativus amylolyticus TaxID=2963434 RepID=UPI0020CC7485|nr:ABC transporter substrate-binding protein [Natrononativus amylolyticus]
MAYGGRNTLTRRTVVQTIGAGGVLALAGCMGDENGETGDDDGSGEDPTVFIDALDSDPGTLDIHTAVRVPEMMCLSPVHERLFTIDHDFEPVPQLATEYESNDDNTEYTIAFEEGVEFHDGTDLTADVAKWNLERAHENSPNAWQFGSLDSIEETGDHELTFHFDEPHPLFTFYLSNVHMGFASREAVEDAGDEYGQETIVGSGPLELEEWARDEEIVYVRNDDYDRGPDFIRNQGPVNFEEYHVRIVPEPTTLLNEVTVGAADASLWVSPSDTGDVEDHDNTDITRVDDAHPHYLVLNVETPPTDELEVREAIAYGVDRDAIITAAVNDEAYPIYSISPHVAVGAMDEETARDVGHEYDPDAARELLDDAGWENDGEGETRERDGEPLELSFFAFEMDPYSSVGEVVQDMLGQIGFDVNLEILESGLLYDRVEGLEHNLLTMALGSGHLAINTLESGFHSDNHNADEGGNNFSMWRNEEFDDRIDSAFIEPDDDEQEEDLLRAQEIILEEVPAVPLLGYRKFYSHKNEISAEGFLEHPWWGDVHRYHTHVLDVDRS